MSTYAERYNEYIKLLREPFIKACRLRFLNPDGTTAFALDNNYNTDTNKTFIAEGNLTVNLQNGQRRTAVVYLDNANEDFSYQYEKLWYGTEIALDEGLFLSSGDPFYFQQGVFVVRTPEERIEPTGKRMILNLVDKWANLDGSLSGSLDGTYEVPAGTNIFLPIAALLSEDRGNGYPIDSITPIFTEYYNGREQTLPNGTTTSMLLSPYTMTVDGGQTIADIILDLAGMINAWVGYDASGALRVDPSQDDIDNSYKPIIWTFAPDEISLLGLSYSIKNEDMYNDYIVVGEALDSTNSQPYARASNYDPASSTNINIVGRKTKRENGNGLYTTTQCEDLATWRLKRAFVLQKAVTISCTQLFHIKENELVEIVRKDKKGSPSERHLIQGFSRPLSGTGTMTINAVSVADIPPATIQSNA